MCNYWGIPRIIYVFVENVIELIIICKKKTNSRTLTIIFQTSITNLFLLNTWSHSLFISKFVFNFIPQISIQIKRGKGKVVPVHAMKACRGV